MGFKLTKDEAARKAALVDDLRELYGKLEDEINAYTAATATFRAPVEDALAKYNEVVEIARGFTEDIASRIENEIDEKSEKWQEGERAEAANSWKSDWENIALDEVEIEWPDDLEVNSPDHATDLEDISDEMES